MHEVALLARLIASCERDAADRPVRSVLVRHASSIDAETLRGAFAMLTVRGPLAGVPFETEVVDVWFDCPDCGFSGVIDSDHAMGRVRVCPECEAISSDPRCFELEVVTTSAPLPASLSTR